MALLQLPLSGSDIDAINAQLTPLTPEQILAWALEHLPGLAQTTAFGLTGLVALDMLSKLTPEPPPLVFLDTLYHFPETYALVDEAARRYRVPVHVYRPAGCADVAAFEAAHGPRLWETNEDAYDYAVKVEPAQRAYAELGVRAVITGRRASQGGERTALRPLEVDATGLLKLNPLFAWTYPFVEWYATQHDVPRNKLLGEGYRSIGDWHSTEKVGEGEGERAGRWKGREKTECGLHQDYFAMKAKAAGGADAHGETASPAQVNM